MNLQFLDRYARRLGELRVPQDLHPGAALRPADLIDGGAGVNTSVPRANVGHSELDIAVVVQTHLHPATWPQADSVAVPASYRSMKSSRTKSCSQMHF